MVLCYRRTGLEQSSAPMTYMVPQRCKGASYDLKPESERQGASVHCPLSMGASFDRLRQVELVSGDGRFGPVRVQSRAGGLSSKTLALLHAGQGCSEFVRSLVRRDGCCQPLGSYTAHSAVSTSRV